MAEANLSEQDPEICQRFEEAANHLQSLVSRVDQVTLLKLYGLYKQASVGVCDTPQPGWFQMQARKKWDAWKELGDTGRETAMRRYVELISATDPEWTGGGGKTKGWAAVSTMPATDAPLDERDKDMFDHVKEGNVARVTEVARQCTDRAALACLRDEGGMALVHWAADRGDVATLRALVTELGADLGLPDGDGQTPLHYAAACGHTEVVRFLLENGADPDASDGGGLVPSDVASESDIGDLLKRSK